MLIRLADLNAPADCQAIVDLLDMYSQNEFGASAPLADDVKQRLIPGLREHGKALALLAFAADQPIGLALCFQGFSSFAAQPLINVHDLAVSPQFRGQGIGGALLNAVADEAARRGCCKVTLEVRADNERAQKLYQKVGYQPTEPQTWFWSRKILPADKSPASLS